MCIFALKDAIDHYVSKSSCVYLCFMDASKAFDKLNHWFLFDKLMKRGLPSLIVRLLIFWYSKQRFATKWLNVISAFFTVSNGVRQGGIMSPLLYNVFMDDLSKELVKSKVGCYIGNMCINHLMYADDSVLLAPSPYALQKLIGICEQYAKNNEVVYNSKKTVCMVIKSKKLRDVAIPDITLNGINLKWIDFHKYLGFYLRNDMSDCDDIKRQMQAIYSKGNMILRKFRKCTDNVKCVLFKAHCMNFYCCQLWSSFRKSLYSRIKVAYNNVFRQLFKIDRNEHISAQYVSKGINAFDVVVRKAAYNLKSRLCNSNNTILQAIINSGFHVLGSAIYNQWKKVLYRF